MKLETLLGSLYNEPDLDKRRYIPDKLAKLGDWQSTQPLGELILDYSQPLIMRNEAVESLGKQGDPRAVAYLSQVLDDDDADLRRTAVWSLGQIGTPETLDLIFSMKSDDSPAVRRWVAKSAGRVRNSEVINQLLDYAEEIEFVEEQAVLADILRALTDQINYATQLELDKIEDLAYHILDIEVHNYVKQAAMLLLLVIYPLDRVPRLDILLPILESLPLNDPLLRPVLIKGLGYADDTSILTTLKDPMALTALGIAGKLEVLKQKLDAQDTENTELIAILEGFAYQKYIPSNIKTYLNSDDLTVKLLALKLLALNKQGREQVDRQFKLGAGKNAILEMYQYYGPVALERYTKTAFDQDKVIRQTTVSVLISDQLLQNPVSQPQIRSILTRVNQSDPIWHIRRDARLGLLSLDQIS